MVFQGTMTWIIHMPELKVKQTGKNTVRSIFIEPTQYKPLHVFVKVSGVSPFETKKSQLKQFRMVKCFCITTSIRRHLSVNLYVT